VQYVLRHTWGCDDYENMKHITVDEFVNGRMSATGERMDFGTGLSRTAVKDGLARAIEHGLLVCIVDDQNKARIKKKLCSLPWHCSEISRREAEAVALLLH
jgi:hypothetical protein